MSSTFKPGEIVKVDGKEGLFILEDAQSDDVVVISIGGWDTYGFPRSKLRQTTSPIPPIFYHGDRVWLHDIETEGRAIVAKKWGAPFIVALKELSIEPSCGRSPEHPMGMLGPKEIKHIYHDDAWEKVTIIAATRMYFVYVAEDGDERVGDLAKHEFRPVVDKAAEVVADITSAISSAPPMSDLGRVVVDALKAGKIRHIKWDEKS